MIHITLIVYLSLRWAACGAAPVGALWTDLLWGNQQKFQKNKNHRFMSFNFQYLVRDMLAAIHEIYSEETNKSFRRTKSQEKLHLKISILSAQQLHLCM